MKAVKNPTDQNQGEKSFRVLAFRLAFGAAAFLLSAALFGFLTLNLAIKRGEKVTVPNVVNKSVVEALDILSERGLELRKSGARNSVVIPEDFVLGQDPIPGTVVKEGTRISVVISLGSKTAAVPDLVGKSLREAGVELKGSGLKVGRFSRIYNPGGADVVLAQSLDPNSQVDRDTQVDLLISLGPRPREYRLPSLIGLPLRRASGILDVMGLNVGNVTSKLDFSQPQGTILDQDPRPGSPITEGQSVALVMSTLHEEGKRLERKFGAILYRVPYGFWSKSVRIEVTDPEGSHIIYDEVDEPGANIRLVFGYSAQCTVRVFLDNKLEMERTFR